MFFVVATTGAAGRTAPFAKLAELALVNPV
jgi:hypothetical protein